MTIEEAVSAAESAGVRAHAVMFDVAREIGVTVQVAGRWFARRFDASANADEVSRWAGRIGGAA